MSHTVGAIIFDASSYPKAPSLTIINMGKSAQGFITYLKNTFKGITILDLFNKKITSRDEIINAITKYCRQESLRIFSFTTNNTPFQYSFITG